MRAAARVPSVEGSVRLEGRHVLLMLLAFFGVVFAVNGIFLVSALTSYTGVVSNEPYVKGLKYNHRIAADEQQQRLGWQEALTVETSGAISIGFHDGIGRPVPGLMLAGTIGRPTTGKLDRPLIFAETAPGHYSANAGPLEAGTWIVELAATSGDFGPDPVYRSRRRVWLKR